MAALTLHDITKRFDKVEVIKHVSFDVADGEFVVFVGPSGCGKSTLLRIICGLEAATEGDVLIDNARVNDVPPARRGLALVFQSYALYPHMTVFQNMAFGLENLNTPKREIAGRVAEAARMLQLEPYLQRRPTALSGGQRQRVAIGRAIVREPKIFLFDEPLSNLDAELRVSMRAELAQLHRRLGTTMIYVTHDQTEAMTMADKIVVLRAGVVEQVGAPLELYNAPANRFVAGFIGSPRMNFLEGYVVAATSNGIAVQIPEIGILHAPAQSPTGTAVTLGIRPEHVQTGWAPINGISGNVVNVEQLGGLCYVRLTNPDLTIQLQGQTALAHGHRADVNLPPQFIHIFDAAGNTPLARAITSAREVGSRSELGSALHPTTQSVSPHLR